LYRLLDRIADPTLDPKYRDFLCIACLPYLHSRMPSVMLVKPPHLMSDQELAETRRVMLEHRKQTALSHVEAKDGLSLIVRRRAIFHLDLSLP
jgi:hypothetical protein